MALTPDYLQKCSDEIDQIFWKLGTRILKDIADRIRHAGGMTSTTEYLNEKLRVFGLQQSMINEMIAVALKTEQSEVDKLMEESTAKSTRQLFENLVAAGYDTTGLEFRDQILKSTNVLNNELTNLTRTTAQLGSARMMDAFDQAYLQVSSGAYSFDEAVANACQKLAREGLGMVEYPSGAHRSIEAAVRVAVRTSVNQNALQCEMDAIKKMGINLVQTSSHLGARPTHAVWQGKIFWLNKEDPRYENFYEATGYGTATGLGGYNCRHSFYPYFEELGEKTYEHFDEEKNREYYEQEQKQRALERKLREWDRREQILKAGGQNTAEASRWKRYYKDQLDDLVKNSNGFLKRDYAAEKAYPAIKAEAAAQKAIDTDGDKIGVSSLVKEAPKELEKPLASISDPQVQNAIQKACDQVAVKGDHTSREELTKMFPAATLIGSNPYTGNPVVVLDKDFSYFINKHVRSGSVKASELQDISRLLNFDFLARELDKNGNDLGFLIMIRAKGRSGFIEGATKTVENGEELYHFQYLGDGNGKKKIAKKKRAGLILINRFDEDEE
ncbi:MAG: phage minor capsid protein [Erysipelotrichaceae bacterium]|nr:phage minor capsid protein [Erysipelotrichaceae bacterium]